MCATELLREGEREGGWEGGRVASLNHFINLKEGEGKMIASPPPSTLNIALDMALNSFPTHNYICVYISCV